MAHRFYQFYRPLPQTAGSICAVRIDAAETSRGRVAAIDIVMTGPGASTIGPVLFLDGDFHFPERLPAAWQDIFTNMLRTDEVRKQLAAGPGVLWTAEPQPFIDEVSEGGLVPGLSPMRDDFAMAMAMRSARALVENRDTFEHDACGFPWASRYCGARTSGFSPRSAAAARVRELYGDTGSTVYTPGDAVVVYGSHDVPEFDLRGAPLVWIGLHDAVDSVSSQLRERYGDVEHFGIVERRSEDYGFFPERAAAPLNVLLVNSCAGERPETLDEMAAVSTVSQPFRLLLVARPDRSKYPIGGVETLLTQTARLMRERGVTVDIAETTTPDASNYDVAHIIGGLAEYVVTQGEAVRASGKPLLITPIYATYEGMTWFASGTLAAHSNARADEQERILDLMRRRIANIDTNLPQPEAKDFRDLRLMQRGLALADNLLICAEAEAREIAVRLGVYRPATLLPNGIDTTVMRPGIPRVAMIPQRPYVLMATRIDSQKNLLGVYDAVRGLDIDAVILGRIDHEFSFIAGLMASNAPENAILIPSTPTQSHPWFGSLFANAAAVMVPSWSEVFSLNVLDGAACGVPVVMGHGGYHAELFGDLGYYADPIDSDSIRDAIVRAVNEDEPTRERRLELARHVRARHDWNAVADRLLDIYQQTARRGPIPLTGIR